MTSQAVYRVPSSSEPGKEYEVRVGADGRLWCSCPAGQRDLNCKHQNQVREELMTETEVGTALVPVKLQPPASMLPTRSELRTINDLAMIAYSSAGIALPKELNTPQKVATVMLYGRELGVKPMTALSQIYLVEGRPTPSAQVMAGILATKEPDSRLEILEADDKHAKLRLQRPSRSIDATYETTIDDAKKAGLVKPGSMWEKYPKERNIYHCTKRILRMYAPEIIHALETADIFEETQHAYNERQLPPAAKVRELYNEGDKAVDDTADFVLDALTAAEGDNEEDDGEPITILEPPFTEEHSEKVQTWRGRIMGERGQAVMMQVIDWAGHEWPHALVQGAFKPKMLSGPQAEQLITVMEDVANRGAAAIPHEHEASFDEDKAITVCGKCGIALEGPPSEGAPRENEGAPAESGQGSLIT